MHATRAAVEEGILPGGGVALLRSIKALGRLKTENHDRKTGIDIVRKALNTPARQIAVNAGEDGSIVVGKINENESYVYGFDHRRENTATWFPKASSIRPRLSAPRCKVRPRLQDC
jgi:chaperonin GroEL